MAGLTTLATLKAWLNINVSTDDALLERMITAMTTAVETWLCRKVLTASYTDVLSGKGGSRLALRNSPITAVSSVTIDGVAVPVSTGPLVAGYTFTDNMIVLRGRSFDRGDLNVSVSYTAGYSAVPADMEQACLEWIALRYKERDRIGHQSKSLAGETVTFITKEMPDSVRSVLDQYRNWGIT